MYDDASLYDSCTYIYTCTCIWYIHDLSLHNITSTHMPLAFMMLERKPFRDVCVCFRINWITAHLSNQYVKLSTDHCCIMLDGYRD